MGRPMDLFDPMSSAKVPRGAAPVGQLAELPAVERLAVLSLRAWCDGGAARARIAEDFQLLLGAEGPAAVRGFDILMQITLQGARRPLMRHALDCACVGGDECAFANLVAAAAGGDREDAMLFASTLLSGAAAYAAARAAEDLGDLFLRFARAAGRERPPARRH